MFISILWSQTYLSSENNLHISATVDKILKKRKRWRIKKERNVKETEQKENYWSYSVNDQNACLFSYFFFFYFCFNFFFIVNYYTVLLTMTHCLVNIYVIHVTFDICLFEFYVRFSFSFTKEVQYTVTTTQIYHSKSIYIISADFILFVRCTYRIHRL